VKTNELISMLSSQVDPVDTREVVRNVRIAILVGAAASLLAVVFVLGVRTDLNGHDHRGDQSGHGTAVALGDHGIRQLLA